MKQRHDYKSRFRILKGGKIGLVISTLLGTMTILSASPSDGVVTTGTATITQSANNMTITQTTNKASINWQSFSVKPNETVNFVQPNSSSVTLNRVIGTTSSLIEGTINANGQVFLLNPNGIVFSKGSSVNVGGLVASTLNMSDEDFQAGNYTLSGSSTNSILNLGTITANSGGYVVLAGKSVSNEGLIKATLGNIHLVGASKVSLNINGNSLIKLTVDKGVLDSLVKNKGIIKANGGEIYLTSQALDTVLNGVVNNTGIIEANSIDTHNGKIVLYAHGGTTTVAGTLDAKDGFIETSGKVLGVKESTNIKTKSWLLDPTNLTIDSSGLADTVSATSVQNSLSSADVTLQADQDIIVGENITWADSTKLTLTAGSKIHVNATINNTNSTNGGVYFNATNTTDKVVFDINGKVKVNNVYQLQWINQALKGKYELGSNIDASATSSWNSGAGFVPIGNGTNNFTGSFDGLGHTVSDLFIDRSTTDFIGLFGWVNPNKVIQNIGLINVNITGHDYTAGLVGYNYGTISNSFTTGKVIGNIKVGGLAGVNESETSIKNSYSTASVDGDDYIGGLVGYNSRKIENSYATGKVSGNNNVGGLVGSNGSGSSQIINSYATGIVTTVNDYAGGLVGYSNGFITNSYATGHVNTGRYYGGGLVAVNNGGTISNSYWDIDTTGRPVGFSTNSGTITNLTGIHSSTGTINAFTESTYTGFDFTNDWILYDGHTRPLLRTFMTALTVTANDATKTYDGNAYTGANGLTYSTTPNSNLLGSVSYSDLSGDTNAGLYSIQASGLYSNQQGYIISYVEGTLTIDPKTLTATYTADNKVYDGTTTVSANGNLNGVISGDIVNFSQTSANFNDKNVGIGKIVTINGIALSGVDASNYAVSSSTTTTADVTPKALTASYTADNKVYDGNTNATATGTSSDIISGDTVNFSQTSANFNDKNVGIGKIVTINGIALSGTDASNYTISSSTTTTADVTPKTLTASYTADNKIYDGNTNATAIGTSSDIISGDNVSFSQTATFNDKKVGTVKAVTVNGIVFSGVDATNYALSNNTATTTADITAKNLIATYSTDNKVYDGDAIATVIGTSSDIVSGDTVSFNQIANFEDENVGINKVVNINSISLSGIDSENYTLLNNTVITNANITHNHIFDKDIKLIKTPVINGTTLNIDNIVQENHLVQMIAPSKIVNKGVKLPIGLFNNEEF